MNEFDRLHALSKRLRETYKPGVRIELNHMCSDPQPIPDGSRGTVVAVDDIGSIMMKWDNGRSLSLIYGEDSFRILSPDEVNAERYEKKNHEFIRKLNKDILKNEKFCGDAILQKTVTLDCISKTHKKNTGEAPMYYVHNNHDPIVSRETFNKAQEELLRRNALKPATTSTVSAQGRYSRYALTEILHCDECGSRYKRCTWTASGEKQIVWRCINRLQHGKKYCSKSPTVKEGVLHSAIVRAINRFNQENETTYRLLMKASLSDALGIGGSNEEMELLTRRIDTLNAKMMKLINDAVSEGRSIDDNEGEFKEISDEIAQLNSRVSAIKELIANDESAKDRLESINAKVEELKDGITEYDDTIVRQMIECIKVYGDKRIEVIFGGGTSIIEEL